jgi:hypothetical protein
MREKGKTKRKKSRSKDKTTKLATVVSRKRRTLTCATQQQQKQQNNNKRQGRSPTQFNQESPLPSFVRRFIHPSIHPALPALPTSPSINANQPRGK